MGKDQLGEVRGLCEGPICLPHRRRLPSFSAGSRATGQRGRDLGVHTKLRAAGQGAGNSVPKMCSELTWARAPCARVCLGYLRARGRLEGLLGKGRERRRGLGRGGVPGTMPMGPPTDGVSEGFFPQLPRQLRGGRVPPPRSPCPALGDPLGWVGGRAHRPAAPSCVMSAGLFKALSVGQRGCRWGR